MLDSLVVSMGRQIPRTKQFSTAEKPFLPKVPSKSPLQMPSLKVRFVKELEDWEN